MNDSVEYASRLDRVLAKKRKIDAELRKVLAECPHTDSRIDDNYIPGDYYNTSQIVRATVCTTCGHILESKTINRGHYG